MVEPKLLEILRTLDAHRVPFVIVGGMAAVIGGAPVVTRDIDVLRSNAAADIASWLAAFEELEAVFRGDARRLRPNASHLSGPGHLLLDTRFGTLDVLGTIEESTTMVDVLPDTTWVDLDDFRVRVLSLERLLVVKRKLSRPKDQLMALQIEAVLEERKKSGG